MLGAVLLALSIVFYCIHYLIFRDSHHIWLYLIGDIAFVFIEVLMVTIIIHRVLETKERKARIDKMNMSIGAFFSEVGTPLLKTLSALDSGMKRIQEKMAVEHEDAAKQFLTVSTALKNHTFSIEVERTNWNEMKSFLSSKRGFMLGLLQNQNLLEHESFTDTLWAIFHLTEELEARESFDNAPETDIKHLCGDITRIYSQLAAQWTAYLQHLKKAYPYLFSLAIRKNPFSGNLTAVVG